MNNIFSILAFSLLSFTNTFSQTYDLQFVPLVNDAIVGGNYTVGIQIRKGSGNDFQVGSSNIRINYNDAGLTIVSEPILTEQNFDNGLMHPVLNIPTYNDITSNGSGSGLVSINIDLNVTGFGFPTISNSAWVNVAVIGFTIDNTTESSQLTFRTTSPGNTVIFEDDQITLLTQGVFFELNEPLDGSILPIELISFDAIETGDQTLLSWATASEINNDYFEVEHSIDGYQFDVIGQVEAIGESNSKVNYSYLHRNPVPGINYYRLRQVDIDGQFTQTEIRVVKFEFSKTEVRVFPNPFSDQLQVQIDNSTTGSLNWQLFDSFGRQISISQGTQSVATERGYEVNGFQNLPIGIYFLRVINTKKEIHTFQLIHY